MLAAFFTLRSCGMIRVSFGVGVRMTPAGAESCPAQDTFLMTSPTHSGGISRPGILAVLNASPDSFSGSTVNAADAADAAAALVSDGADVIDIGAQSLRTDQAEIPVEEEIARLLPVLAAVRDRLPVVTISVDTYRHQVVEAALAHGVQIVNDPSGLIDPSMGEVVADAGLELVLTYNIATPKIRLAQGELAADPVADCTDYLATRLSGLAKHGVPAEKIILDLGADLGKSPGQTIEVLRATPSIRAGLGVRRVLWALSRKDFIGALVEEPPRGRGPGTLGAMAALDIHDEDLLRVHDVVATAQFFAVQRAITRGVDGPLELRPDLRHNPA